MNEFYLGALDLSPYIVSVQHQFANEFRVITKQLPDSLYIALKEMSLLMHYTSPLFIKVGYKIWTFLIKIEYADMYGFIFQIRKFGDVHALVLCCPLPFQPGKSKEMA